MKERRGCPNCAKALALINQHLSGRVYDDLDDALRNLLQAFVTMRDLRGTLGEIKAASIVVHAQELLSADGREADKRALIPLLEDPDVLGWLRQFDKALLPVKRRQSQ